MYHRSLIAVTLLALALTASPALASSSPSRPAVVLTTFQLHVEGVAQAGETYWVAYGPLAGRFGILRLWQTKPGVFTASRRLPTVGKSRFTYVEGHGTVRTRAGLEPGIPVVTIRTIGPLSVWPNGLPSVHWQPASG